MISKGLFQFQLFYILLFHEKYFYPLSSHVENTHHYPKFMLAEVLESVDFSR